MDYYCLGLSLMGPVEETRVLNEMLKQRTTRTHSRKMRVYGLEVVAH